MGTVGRRRASAPQGTPLLKPMSDGYSQGGHLGFDAALAAVLFLGATWFGLLVRLISTTRTEPANAVLWPAAFAHWLIFLYFALSATILYSKGWKANGSKPIWLIKTEKLLLLTWPAAFGASVFGYCATRFTSLEDGILITITYAIPLLYIVYKNKIFLGYLLAIFSVVGFIPYLYVMSLVWADVNITTDKEEYVSSDSIIVKMISEGYLFNPSIEEVQLLTGYSPKYIVPDSLDPSFIVVALKQKNTESPSKEHTRREYISVRYRPQLSWFERNGYKVISFRSR